MLLNIVAHKGVPYPAGLAAIYPADLDAWENKAGIKVGPCDVINTACRARCLPMIRFRRAGMDGALQSGNHAAREVNQAA